MSRNRSLTEISGSFHRLAQGVLSREDPQEVSLREMPSVADVEGMEIIYPVR